MHENEDDPMMDKEFALPALPVLKVDGDDVEYGGCGFAVGMRQRTTSTTSTCKRLRPTTFRPAYAMSSGESLNVLPSSSDYTARCPSECSNSIWASANVLDMGSSLITLNDPIPYVATSSVFLSRTQGIMGESYKRFYKTHL